jgi:Arc/MetJ family transcription regulator
MRIQAEQALRTTVTLDEALLSRAQTLSGVQDRSALLKEALGALIQRESARRLAKLGGSEPKAKAVSRRRDIKP